MHYADSILCYILEYCFAHLLQYHNFADSVATHNLSGAENCKNRCVGHAYNNVHFDMEE